ncbi:ABC transporter substrate-binding protein [Clostridium sp. NSJ-6]|uniref:ABC transporter substrate-binding protein n=1 Tax=Clostridium hominis TaxID=2763036 RepID=A0ABR7D7H2_9CLOT|nr:ABC transporter substrate-binding protein [Clostridium hominis]MBC5627326.1 ABC transporter substrate-binding protein [Clostridium hominis]
MKKKFKSIIMMLIVAMLAFGLVSCGEKKTEEENTNNVQETVTTYPLTITDTNGKEIVIEKEPQTVVSLGPNVTEMIYSLDKGDKLAGRTKYCDYPEQALEVQEVGTLTKPNLELIAEIKPDLVVASTHFKEEAQAKLDELGIPTIVLYSEDSFDGVYKSIQTLGQILNASPKAGEVVAGMKDKVAEVTKKVEGLEAPSMYYVVGFGEKDSTAGGNTFIGEMIRMANGKNIADDSEGWSYSKEKLAEKNPEMIVLSKYYDTKVTFTTTDFYKDLDAVKNDKVYEIDENMLNRQGPRLADGLEALAKILHPEAFN